MQTLVVEVGMIVRGLVVLVLEENAEGLEFGHHDRPFLEMVTVLASDDCFVAAAVDAENCAGLSRIGYLPD